VSGNLQEAGTNFSAKYLRLDGSSAMTGKLGVFNGSLLSAPTTGLTGGNGDSIVLWSGNVGSFPY
jgi:hypothetical protein